MFQYPVQVDGSRGSSDGSVPDMQLAGADKAVTVFLEKCSVVL